MIDTTAERQRRERATFDQSLRQQAEERLLTEASARPPAVAGALRLKVVSDGTREGTYLADAQTGQRVDLDARVSLHVHWPARCGERARVTAVFEPVAVEAPPGTLPFEFHG